KQHGNHFSGYEFALGIRFGIKIISPRSGYLNFVIPKDLLNCLPYF
ncbi:MAG: hypothetical protein HW390_3425, partial [Candidatus Brocadiaceae bacterium]|nr:hypothetical protein [Candidatus Brocadiaceae bacterium]